MRIPFVKMDGCGNDYVFLTSGFSAAALSLDFPELARRISNRHTGVGSDGLILVESGDTGCSMRMWNADGSIGELCLNGLRCAALLAVIEDNTRVLEFSMGTDAGPMPVSVSERGSEARVHVRLKPPRVVGRGTYNLGGAPMQGQHLNLGNPHCVFWMPSIAAVQAVDLRDWGTQIQQQADFSQGVNVHFAATDGEGVMVRHWERGSGATRACGSGAVATWMVARGMGVPGERIRISMPGGSIHVSLSGDEVLMEGPARESFRGTWPD